MSIKSPETEDRSLAGEASLRAGIYMASKTTHAPRWREFRNNGLPIISTWIDEAGKGETACFKDLWRRCVSEACAARAVIVYREPGEVLKGAFVEAGSALATGVPVFTVGCEEFSFVNHSGVKQCRDIEHALDCALATSPPQAEIGALDREAVARIIIGPRNPVPATSKFTLRHLQDIRWSRLSEQEKGEALWIADAILDHPPTTRHDAAAVEALRANQQEFERYPALAAAIEKYACINTLEHWNELLGRLNETLAVLPAQPGPAPVGKGEAIEAALDRPAFEKWIKTFGFPITKRSLGGYINSHTVMAWNAWQGARKAALEAALARIPAIKGGMWWQPIETAPKDGTKFDAWVVHPQTGGFGFRFANVQMRGDGSGFGVVTHQPGAVWDYLEEHGPTFPAWKLTHWQPLPAAPTQTARDGGKP